jgi:hypothetical protein
MPSLMSLPTELLNPILQHTLIPLPTSLPMICALSLTHPRLYALTLHVLEQTLASYEAVGTNQLLPHPYSRKDEKGEVLYQDFAGMKAGMERIVEWRWVRGRLPTVIAKMERGIPDGGFCWAREDGSVDLADEIEEDVVLGSVSNELGTLELDDVRLRGIDTAEDREARAKLTAWLLGKKYSG